MSMCPAIDHIEFLPEHMSESECNALYETASRYAWFGNEIEKQFGEKVIELIRAYESACTHISTCVAIDSSEENDDD